MRLAAAGGMSLLAHTALLAQQAFGPLDGVGTALAGWAVDDPDRHRPKPPVVDGDTLRLFGDTRVYCSSCRPPRPPTSRLH